jgi:hypothetical protein
MPTQTHPKKANFAGHKSQNHGHGVGVPKKVLDNYPKGGGSGPHESQNHGHGMGIPTRGNTVKSTGAKSACNGGGIFKTSGPVLKNSGVSGAHRLGCKK